MQGSTNAQVNLHELIYIFLLSNYHKKKKKKHKNLEKIPLFF